MSDSSGIEGHNPVGVGESIAPGTQGSQSTGNPGLSGTSPAGKWTDSSYVRHRPDTSPDTDQPLKFRQIIVIHFVKIPMLAKGGSYCRYAPLNRTNISVSQLQGCWEPKQIADPPPVKKVPPITTFRQPSLARSQHDPRSPVPTRSRQRIRDQDNLIIEHELKASRGEFRHVGHRCLAFG